MVCKRGSPSISNSHFISQKKGQVTVFIIVGIIMLFAFAGILVLTKFVTKETATAEGESIITEVPQQFRSIQRYTENCLQQTAKQGLLLLGQQGGYIHPELEGDYSITNPTDSVGIDLQPTKIPYWYYNAEGNNARVVHFASLQPALTDGENSVELQLSRYVTEKIPECLNDYASFTGQGFLITADEIDEAQVQISDESVGFILKMPVKVRKEGSEAALDVFFVKVPLRLRYYYEIASAITAAQKDFSFLEKHGLELLSIYSRKDVEYFAPISDVGYELFSPLSWSESLLKQKFKELLTSYVPMLRFLGSSNFYYFQYPEGNALAQKIIDNTVLPLTGADDLDISFDYFGWEPYFKTNSENGVIKPEHIFVDYEVLHFGTQRYETHYDISYPVLITLHDDAALGGEGYTFSFTLEANIRNNEPAVGEVTREVYPKKVSPIVCNPEQGNSALLKTIVVDSFTKEPLDLVRVGFTVPEQTECEIGTTDNAGSVESSYPSVYGGVINFVKPDYLTNFYPIDTYKYAEQPVILGYPVPSIPEEQKVIELDKIATKTVRIVKKELEKCVTPLVCSYTSGVWTALLPIPYKDISCEVGKQQCFFNGGKSTLGDPLLRLIANGSLSQFHDYYFINKQKLLEETEEAVLTLERVQGFHDEVVSGAFTTVISVKGEQTAEIPLVPGIYKMSGIITKREEVVIPAEQRCFRYSIVGYGKEDCFALDENKFDTVITGNMQWDIPETYITITPEDLYPSQEIVFTVLTQDLSSAPLQIDAKAKQCGGFVCLSGVGCLFNGCTDKTISINGRVIEDLQVAGKITDIAKQPDIRAALELQFK